MSAAILAQTDDMIQIQGQREFSAENSTLLKDMIDFRTSFDTMMTNLYGFTVVRDFNFKAGYLYRVPWNTTAWENLRQKQTQTHRDTAGSICRHRPGAQRIARLAG